MKGNTILLLVTLINVFSGNAQSFKASKYNPLRVGDQVPEYNLINLINYHSKAARLNDFRGKLLILDFWSTGCASCIESWPKLQLLQNQFKDEIQIILVNAWEDEKTVKKLIERRKAAGIVNLTLPSVCKDSLILELFPAKTVPHIVWIDPQGIVKSITYGDVLNHRNISSILKGANADMYQKTDRTVEVDYSKPFFVNGNGGDGKGILTYSMLSKYTDGLDFTYWINADRESGYSINVLNLSVLDLYRFAYSDRYSAMNDRHLLLVPMSQVELQVEDPNRFVGFIDGEMNRENCYVYQLISNQKTKSNLLKIMQEDLRRFFGLDVKWEKRVKDCYVLGAEDIDRIKYTSGEPKYLVNDVTVNLNDVTADVIREQLEHRFYSSDFPIVNEISYKGRIGGINFNTNVKDPVMLDRNFAKYKMQFKLARREVNVLVIRDSHARNPDYDNE